MILNGRLIPILDPDFLELVNEITLIQGDNK